MQYALIDTSNTVRNLIVYDRISPYTPPDGLTLTQVNDWVQIGQPVNVPQPA